MGETFFPLSADDGHDDLPRTFRRARAEKEREAAELEAKATNTFPSSEHIYASSPSGAYPVQNEATEFPPVSVKRFEVPFLSLVMFFIKAVVAAIPALILLVALIWLGGEILQSYFPWLVKMQIFIHFPE